jgi:hypothetical protein
MQSVPAEGEESRPANVKRSAFEVTVPLKPDKSEDKPSSTAKSGWCGGWWRLRRQEYEQSLQPERWRAYLTTSPVLRNGCLFKSTRVLLAAFMIFGNIYSMVSETKTDELKYWPIFMTHWTVGDTMLCNRFMVYWFFC